MTSRSDNARKAQPVAAVPSVEQVRAYVTAEMQRVPDGRRLAGFGVVNAHGQMIGYYSVLGSVVTSAANAYVSADADAIRSAQRNPKAAPYHVEPVILPVIGDPAPTRGGTW